MGPPYAVGVSFVSLLVFNWFFLPPVHTFALDEASNWTALLVYLATAVVTSELRRECGAELQRPSGASATQPCSPTSPPASWSAATSDSDRTGRAFGRPCGRATQQAVASLVAIANERERLEREALEAETLRRTDAVKTAVIQSCVASTSARRSQRSRPPSTGFRARRSSWTTHSGRELLESVRHELAAARAIRRERARSVAPSGRGGRALAGHLDGRCAGRARARRPAATATASASRSLDLPPISDRCRTDAAGACQRDRERAEVLAPRDHRGPARRVGAATTSSSASTMKGRASNPRTRRASSSRFITLTAATAPGSASRSRVGSSRPTAAASGLNGRPRVVRRSCSRCP